MPRTTIVGAIVRKDLRAFARDRFYVIVSILGIVFYVVILWLLPATVNETVRFGLVAPDLPPAMDAVLDTGTATQGLAVVRFDDADALRAAVGGAGTVEVPAGIVLPEGFVASLRAGEGVTATVMLAGDVPDEIRLAVTGFVKELAYTVAGEPLPVAQLDLQELVVGQDRAGAQVSLRDRMRPLFAFFVLLVESLALASLVASEIQQRTAVAILVTPARASDLLAAKAVVGTGIAFLETVLLLVLTGTLQVAPGGLLLTVALGAVLVTGIGMIAGSLGRDFITIVFWSMAFMIPLAVPAIGVLFPGSAAWWVRILPSHGFVAAVVDLAAYGRGIADVAADLLSLAAWSAALLGIGVLTLRRRIARA